MNLRKALTAFGTGITVFLVTSVFVISLLEIEFSALIGLPVGLIAGTLSFVLVLLRHEDFDRRIQWVAAGVAGFGYGVILSLGIAYVNLIDMGFEGTIGVGVATAVIFSLGAVFLD
jgi:hypothetical protein